MYEIINKPSKITKEVNLLNNANNVHIWNDNQGSYLTYNKQLPCLKNKQGLYLK